MKTHTFTLVLDGVSDVTPELADALYEATQGDIEFKMRDGVAFLEVTRAAPTRRRAIASVIREVENAGSWRTRGACVKTEVANTRCQDKRIGIGLDHGAACRAKATCRGV